MNGFEVDTRAAGRRRRCSIFSLLASSWF